MTLIATFTLTIAMFWPLEQQPHAPAGIDKIAHFVAFATLAFPLARTGRFGLLPVFVSASVFGGMIEVLQPNFNRSSELNDWIADIAGVAFGIFCGFLYRYLRRK